LPRQLEKLAVRWHGTVGRRFLALVLEDVPAPKGPAGPSKGFASKAPPGPPPARKRPEQRLMLRSWDWLSGKADEPRELLRGRRPLVLASLDEQFLFLRDAAPSPDELVASEAERRFDWGVYSLAAGKFVARLPHAAGTQSVLVLNERAYFLVGGAVRGPLDRGGEVTAKLRAVELKSGKLLWERAVAGKNVRLPEAP
jgi:hypothetical protein